MGGWLEPFTDLPCFQGSAEDTKEWKKWMKHGAEEEKTELNVPFYMNFFMYKMQKNICYRISNFLTHSKEKINKKPINVSNLAFIVSCTI